MDDSEKQAQRNARRRQRAKERRAADPEFCERERATDRAWYAANKADIAARKREKYAADSDVRAKIQARHLRSKYGISPEDFTAMLAQQHNACGICERTFVRKPCVDHCHFTGLVRGLLCRKCNVGIGQLEDNPVFARKSAAYLERWWLHLIQLFNTEENDMMSNDDATDDDKKAARLMREAILHELHQPFGVEPPPPADWLQAVSRFLVTKAAQDLSAVKEVLDRIDGKTPSTPAILETLKQVNVTWKYPPSKLNPPKENQTKQTSSESAPKATRSSTKRASSSSPSTSATSGSPAS